MERLTHIKTHLNSQQTIGCPFMASHSVVDNVTEKTMQNGAPIGNDQNSLTAGPTGPILLMDSQFLEKFSHFNRERIPERVAHSHGTGASGYFEVTNPDMAKYTKADFLNKLGKRTPIFSRFSLATQDKGTPDTLRDKRGFAVKFYTEEGNWDLTMLQAATFFINDPILFPDLIHAAKKNPKNGLIDYNTLWDFLTLHPVTFNAVLQTFGDDGLPDGYDHMGGFSQNTFKLVDGQSGHTYFRIVVQPDAGLKPLTLKQGADLASVDLQYNQRKLKNQIESGNFPTWTMYFQLITPEAEKNFKYSVHDAAKILPESLFPLTEVGKIVLNRIPESNFNEVENVAFAPRNLVPGIEPSEFDRLLQGRMFAYSDAQTYRLGVNHHLLPINQAKNANVQTNYRDGFMNTQQFSKEAPTHPNYSPNTEGGPTVDPKYNQKVFQVTGTADRQPVPLKVGNFVHEDPYEQPREIYAEYDSERRQRLSENIARELSTCRDDIKARALKIFYQISPDLCTRLANLIGGNEMITEYHQAKL